MIVYAGKQFGNDFNNGDEGVFQDANRPRDFDKFKLKPGINTGKNDFRTANSGIAAQGTFYGTKSQAGQSTISFNVANMDNKNAVIIGRPYVKADGDIIVGKSGVYAVTCQAQFVAPSGYNVSNSVNYKFYVAFLLNGGISMYTQGRGCGSMDTFSVFYVGWLDAGDKVNVGFMHTDTSDTFTVNPSINLYRLS